MLYVRCSPLLPTTRKEEKRFFPQASPWGSLLSLMTKGTFVIFTQDAVYLTTEFNGDMYFDGHGELVAAKMQEIHTPAELLAFAKKFNQKKFHYPEEQIALKRVSPDIFAYEDMLDMQTDYFKKYFSDYIYIANAAGHALVFHTKNGDRTLPDNTSGVLKFGRDATDFPPHLDAFQLGSPCQFAGLHKDESQRIGQKTGVQLSAEDVREAANIMNQKGYRTIAAAYVDMTAYVQLEIVSRFGNGLAQKYFDVDRYIGEEKQALEAKGIYELQSGHVLMFET